MANPAINRGRLVFFGFNCHQSAKCSVAPEASSVELLLATWIAGEEGVPVLVIGRQATELDFDGVANQRHGSMTIAQAVHRIDGFVSDLQDEKATFFRID